MGMRGNQYENEMNAKVLIGHGDFLAGYAVHLVTDLYWSRQVFEPFYKKFKARFPNADHSQTYYNDCDMIDLQLYQEEPWRAEVYDALDRAHGEDAMDMLTAEEVEKWRLRQLHWFEQDFSHLKPAEYITPSEVNAYIDYTVEKCLEYF